MSIVLYHHPWSRAAGVVWMLEELGQPYELRFVDLMAGEHRQGPHESRNRMKKLPVLEDGDVVVSETAAIGVYLADRYALGELAPALDDAQRGEYLRWCFFSPSVIEPACMAKSAGWEYKASSAGFGRYEDVVATVDEAAAKGPWLLGDRFTMADVIVGGTLRWMLRFNMFDRTEAIGAYADRLGERAALQRANARNDQVSADKGLPKS